MDPELTVNDLRHVHEAVHPARTSWYDIGLQLQVPVDVLDSIEQENGNDRDRLRNMLKTWLKRGGATWGALSDALKSPTVGEHQLAKKLDIRARHERVQPQSTSIEEGVSILTPHSQAPDTSVLPVVSGFHRNACSSEGPPGTQDAVVIARLRIKQLEENYFTMVTTTQEVVRRKAPSIEEFRTTITLLPTLAGVKREQQQYLRDHLEYIYQAKSIDQIFGYLNSQVWSYLNFGLLECIVAKYGDPTTKKTMEDYRASVQSFRKDTPLHVFLDAQPEVKCPEIPPSLEKTLQEVKIKYDSLTRYSSLEEVECIRLELVRELALPDFAVVLKQIGIGSITIVWILPASLNTILKDKIENQSFQFIQWADVVEVAIAGTRIYPPATMAQVPSYVKEEPTHQVSYSSQKMPELRQVSSTLNLRRLGLKWDRTWQISILTVLVLMIALLWTLWHPRVEQSIPNDSTCTELEKPCLHCGSDKFAPNNLPYVRGPFVGRESELLQISNILLTNSADIVMVSIFGALGVGKSTLAIHVGHVLASKGMSVRYVNLNEAHHLFARHASNKPTHIHRTAADDTDLIFHKGNVIPWYSYTERNYVFISAKKLLTWSKKLKNDTLLILDNCDDFLQGNKPHENNFKNMLIELLKASKYLRIVTTSRAKMLIVGGFHPYLLKELDPTSAVTLLQSRSNLITSDGGKEIAELVGNNPLALGIVAALINTESSPPHAIINELRKHLMRTLSPNILPNSQRISTVLKLSYNYLDDRFQVCSHYLSHFPGSFHRAAAQSILSMCNLSDPEYCLQTLVEKSLLEEYWHTDHFRYQFHRLTREFLHYIQEEHSDGHAIKLKTEFTLNYQLYYSQDILSLSQIYSRSPDSNEMISRLEHDMHNFLNILQKMAERQLDFKSALNIAYSFTNSSDFLIELIHCDDCFTELLLALTNIFDQKINETLQEIGLHETTILYFDLIFNVKRLLIVSKVSSEPCMAVCTATFITHYSRVEFLSAADSIALDKYYYHPLFCSMDCIFILDLSCRQIVISLCLLNISLIIMKFIRQCDVKNLCIIIVLAMLEFSIIIASMQHVVQLTVVLLLLVIIIVIFLCAFIINSFIQSLYHRHTVSITCTKVHTRRCNVINWCMIMSFILSFIFMCILILIDLLFSVTPAIVSYIIFNFYAVSLAIFWSHFFLSNVRVTESKYAATFQGHFTEIH